MHFSVMLDEGGRQISITQQLQQVCLMSLALSAKDHILPCLIPMNHTRPPFETEPKFGCTKKREEKKKGIREWN